MHAGAIDRDLGTVSSPPAPPAPPAPPQQALRLITEHGIVTPAELDQRVAERRLQLGASRRLVVLEGGNHLDFVVTYLAARAGGHALVLTGNAGAGAIIDRYDPDVVVSTDRSDCSIDHRRAGSSHRLHPDLALLMSTSGSSGNPKLVRLTSANLDANARSIAQFQRLGPDDCGVTSLPLHYCYGLSVLNAHHAAGGSIVLTDLSVVDACFWSGVEANRVTNLAGVPHTFELIARAGEERLRLDHLRLVTVAGGRMQPEQVRHMAELGRRWGWDFVVMYGQTEATARMAYLPADLAAEHPDRVGIAVPGGRFEIRPCPDLDLPDGSGEVVYRGPNVMMGYAEQPRDLACGSELDHLDTGDLGRIDEHGLLEIVGRRSRFAKLFGLRIDLGRVERQLAERGVSALCASDDARLVVAVEGPAPGATAALVAGLTALPARSIDVVECEQLPRLASGKPDVIAVLGMGAGLDDSNADRPRASDTVDSIFCDVLDVAAVGPHDTFASLGGDSFSYVEASIRLEALLGHLPAGWQRTSVESLRAVQPRRSARWVAQVETSVVLRALAIVTIVITHMRIARVPAGAHVLLAVVGFNFARFQVPRLARTGAARWWHDALSPIGRLAAVTSGWTALQMLLWGGYGWTTLLLVNNYLGAPQHVEGRWRFWFFESILVTMLLVVVLFGFGRVRELARRRPLWLPMLLLIPAAALRFEVVRLVDRDYNYVYRPDTIAWCFLLGWAAAAAATWRQRLCVSLAAPLLAYGYFGNVDREVRVMLAVVAMAWIPTILVPRPLARPLGWVASASMWIFMTHWLVWPEWTPILPPVGALTATVATGVALWASWRAIAAQLRAWRGRNVIRDADRVRMVEHA
jgi:acyl-CoA synthetase (AMP-forming)/AMP-acid ligase II